MKLQTYKNFYIVQHTGKRPAVDIVNPHNGKMRVVKSEQAAKWRITRALNLANKVQKLV